MNKEELIGHKKIRNLLENPTLFVTHTHKWLIDLTRWCINNFDEKNEVKLITDCPIDCVECGRTDILYISVPRDHENNNTVVLPTTILQTPFVILFCLSCLRIIVAEYPLT